ncbi:MAG TPA: hypothetical protein VIH68_06345 [Bacteroidota bacterium]
MAVAAAKQMTKPDYERRLSLEEVRGRKVMITRDALEVFPRIGKTFTIEIGNKKFTSSIFAQPCHCRGPGKPHEHFWLNIKEISSAVPWRPRLTLEFRKSSESVYSLSVQE